MRTSPTATVINSFEGVWLLEFGVGDDDEFSHDCGDGDEGFFAGEDEALVEGFEVGIVFSGGEGGHEQNPFDLGSAAAGSAVGFGQAALFWVGSQACEGCGLAAGERAELRHEGDQGGGGLGADAFDGDEGFDGAGDRLALGGQGGDVGVDGFDLRIEAFEERVEMGLRGPGANRSRS
jgi:hypothetical protein